MISEDLLGWLTLLLVISITALIARKHPKTSNFIFVALILRSLAVIFDEYFFYLPGSRMDAWTFEQFAFRYSENYGLDIFSQMFNGDSYFLSKIISIFYTLLDRSPMMAKMFSVGFGTTTVFLIYRLTLIIWGSRTALKIGWFAAFFPSLVLYSAVIMREIYIIFFLTYALISCVNFIDKYKFIYFLKSSFGFFMTALFHGPMILGFFIFLIYIFFLILKKNNYFIRFKKKNIYFIFLLPLILVPIITFFLGYYEIPKIGHFNNIGDLKKEDQKKVSSLKDRLLWKMDKAQIQCAYWKECKASYPFWIVPKDFNEMIYLTPVRMFYFLYSPFPWDIKKPSHLIGLVESIFYIYLSICIFRNWKILFVNPQTRFLIMIFIMYIFVFSFGVGNFGTSIRHRLKFIGILLAIAAPKIARIKLSKIK